MISTICSPLYCLSHLLQSRHSHGRAAAVTNLTKLGKDHLKIYDKSFSLKINNTPLPLLYHQIEVFLLFQSSEVNQSIQSQRIYVI